MNTKILTEKDYPIAINLYCESFNKEPKAITIPLLGELIGLYKNNELIGLIQIDYINNILENQKQAIINNFCIKKEEQHKGYGNYLLNESLEYLKSKNIDCVIVRSKKSKIYAHMLYQKNNFEIIDTILLNKNLN